MTTRWWWLRHAPVAGGGITGRLDVPCDVSDRAAFAALAKRLPAGAVLVESGLGRCRATAEALRGAGLDLPPPLIEPELVEQDFGIWQGRSWSEIDAPAFWADPAGTAPPGGESFARVVARVAGAVKRLTAAHAGRDVIAIAHAGSIRAAVTVALDLTPAAALRLAVEPLSLTRLDHVGDAWRVVALNREP